MTSRHGLWMVLCAMAWVMVGCNGPYVASDVKVNKGTEGRPAFGMPIAVPESDWVLVPFSVERPQRAFEFDSAYGVSAGYEFAPRAALFSMPPRRVEWHNVVFHRPTTGESRVLLERKAVISEFWMPRKWDENRKPQRPPFLMFSIIDRDTNGDGVIGNGDAAVGYICELDGRNLRPISPADMHLKAMAYDWERQLLYLMASADTNGDKKFNCDDASELLVYALKDGKVGQRLLSDQVRQDVERIMRK